jgi:hypothetical protein
VEVEHLRHLRENEHFRAFASSRSTISIFPKLSIICWVALGRIDVDRPGDQQRVIAHLPQLKHNARLALVARPTHPHSNHLPIHRRLRD